MTRRWAPTTYKWVVSTLRYRDGPYCQRCLRPFTEPPEVHHRNGNRQDPDESNLELRCPPCHKLTTWSRNRGSERPPKENEIQMPDIDLTHASPELTLSAIMMPTYRAWIYEYLIANGSITLNDATNAGAELLRQLHGRGTPTTTARYLAMLTSELGPLQRHSTPQGQVFITLKEKLCHPKNQTSTSEPETSPSES